MAYLPDVAFIKTTHQTLSIGEASASGQKKIVSKPDVNDWGDTLAGRPVKLINEKPKRVSFIPVPLIHGCGLPLTQISAKHCKRLRGFGFRDTALLSKDAGAAGANSVVLPLLVCGVYI